MTDQHRAHSLLRQMLYGEQIFFFYSVLRSGNMEVVHFQCDGATSMVFIKGRFWQISSMSHSGYICESQTQIMPWADGQGLRCCSHETVILKNTLLKDSQRWLYL